MATIGEVSSPVLLGYADTARTNLTRWVPRTSGGYMCCYINSSMQLVTAICNDASFMSEDYGIDSETVQSAITFSTNYTNGADLVRLPNGKALLFVLEWLTDTSVLRCYESASGNGGDWVYKNDVHAPSASSNGTIKDGTECHAIVAPNGRIFVSANVAKDWFDYAASGLGIFTSDDNGATWTTRLYTGRSTTAVRGCSQVAVLPDRCWLYYTRVNYTTLYESLDGGATWSGRSIGTSNYDDCAYDSLQGAAPYYDTELLTAFSHLTYPFGGSGPGAGLFNMVQPTTTMLDNHATWYRLSTVSGMGTVLAARVYALGDKVVAQYRHDDGQKLYTVEKLAEAASCAAFYRFNSAWHRIRR